MPQLIFATAITPSPWKNGGGLTRDLLVREGLKISLADIERDGAFSNFAGLTRFFAVIEGEGVELTFKDRVIIQRLGDPPLQFDGGDAPYCRLLNRKTRDLNMMLPANTHGSMRHENTKATTAKANAFFNIRDKSLLWNDTPMLFSSADNQNGIYLSW